MRSVIIVITIHLIACIALAANAEPASRRSEAQTQPTTSPWGRQTDEESRAAVLELKRQMRSYQQHTRVKLTLYETKYFLFYSNLATSDSAKWTQVLDRMHVRLAQIFNVPKETNLWYGKAVIVVFVNREDFLSYEKAAYNSSPLNKAGVCHSWKNGQVHIVFYRSPSEHDFAKLLVHESTHGFLHRYRSPVHVTSWVNEGLAEVMAYELVPHAGLKQSNDARARSNLRRPRALDGLFDSQHILGEQYPIARTLAEFMIRRDKERYVAFIDAIKDGADWKQSLSSTYGMTLPDLVAAYGESMGVRDLKP